MLKVAVSEADGLCVIAGVPDTADDLEDLIVAESVGIAAAVFDTLGHVLTDKLGTELTLRVAVDAVDSLADSDIETEGDDEAEACDEADSEWVDETLMDIVRSTLAETVQVSVPFDDDEAEADGQNVMSAVAECVSVAAGVRDDEAEAVFDVAPLCVRLLYIVCDVDTDNEEVAEPVRSLLSVDEPVPDEVEEAAADVDADWELFAEKVAERVENDVRDGDGVAQASAVAVPIDDSVAVKALDPENVAVAVSCAVPASNAVGEGVSEGMGVVDIDFMAETVGIEVYELFAEVVKTGDAVDECDDEGVDDDVPQTETDIREVRVKVEEAVELLVTSIGVRDPLTDRAGDRDED